MSRKRPPRPHIQGKPKAPKPAPKEGDFVPGEADIRMAGAVALIGRTGATNFGLRYQDDEEPVIWTAMAEYATPRGKTYKVAAALTPPEAVFTLCADIMDGARCTHCHRVTGFTPDFEEQIPKVTLRDDESGEEEELTVCWYQWDPELQTYRRGCE